MTTFDGRKLQHSAREAIRIRAVRRILAGESPETIAKGLGFHRSAVYQWLKRYENDGLKGLKYHKIPGRQATLSKAQKQKIFNIITSKNPLQLNFSFALWTRRMVKELILDRFGVELSEVSVGRLLRELGLNPQRLLRRTYRQDPARVTHWLEETYPTIQKEAKAVGALICFGDEAWVRSESRKESRRALKRKTLVDGGTNTRRNLNLISAVSAQGQGRFMTVSGQLTAGTFIEFLERLLKNQTRPVFLIVEGDPVHCSFPVKTFVESTEGRLKLFYLPTYPPEPNLNEQD